MKNISAGIEVHNYAVTSIIHTKLMFLILALYHWFGCLWLCNYMYVHTKYVNSLQRRKISRTAINMHMYVVELQSENRLRVMRRHIYTQLVTTTVSDKSKKFRTANDDSQRSTMRAVTDCRFLRPKVKTTVTRVNIIFLQLFNTRGTI